MYITATAMHGCIRAVAALAVAGLVGSACVRGEADSATPLPRELHGLELGDLHTGDDAARLIGRLHGSNVSPSESYVGYYGPPEMRAILYLSRFHDHSGAQSQLVAMADRIGSGSGGFGHHTQFHVLGIEIHSVFGYGQPAPISTDANELPQIGSLVPEDHPARCFACRVVRCPL
jgi:hypothetical protein